MKFFATVLLLLALPAAAQSLYTARPADPLAITADATMGLHADGIADDTAALQAAIDRVADTTGQGIVFLPQGRYRVTQTLHLWSGVRLIGYGASRPVLTLAPNTPGYQTGHDFLGTGRYMLQFASRKVAAGAEIVDANEFTFYSGVSNVDFEVGDGNPAAICIRFHVAQHSFLSHIHFAVGKGRAALEDVGNQADTLEIDGGDYGIVSVRTSPAWQFLLMDSHLSGQRVAAIRTQEVGMTLVRDTIERTPIAIEIPVNMPEQLYARDLLLRDITRSAIVLGDTTSQHHQVTLDHMQCAHVAKLLEATHNNIAAFSPINAPSPHFVEDRLTVGQEIDANGREGAIALRHREHKLTAAPKAVATDIPALPPVSAWTNVRTLGVTGDGGTDDTTALQHAIDTHPVLYFPMGLYRVRGTLHLKADSVLIGLSPVATAIVLNDNDPNFMGEGAPIPLIESSTAGHEIVTGIGIFTGSVAPRAAGIVWKSGPKSFLQDVNFPAGLRGSPLLAPKYPQRPFNPQGPQGPDMRSSQHPSLWVRDGGGGIIRDVWTADTTANAGLLIENTTTPSVAYQISCEHHMHNEVQFHHAANWTVYALQTEEEKPNGAEAMPLELIDSHDITFANLFNYRVSRNVIPQPTAVTATRADNIRFANMHVFSMTRLAFDNALIDSTRNVSIRTHDFTAFTLNNTVHPGSPLPVPAAFEAGSSLQRRTTAGTFSNIAGLVPGEHGDLYFTDAAMHTIARWDAANKAVVTVTKSVETPMALGYAGHGTLLALDFDKAVYAIDTNTNSAKKLAAEDARANTTLMLPTGFHNDIGSVQRMVAHQGYVYAPRSNMALMHAVEDEPRSFYYAPGTDTAIMAGGSWKGLLQAVQLAPIKQGASRYAISEEDDKVYRLTLDSLTHLSAATLFPRSGTSVVSDTAGNLYIAGAQVFVYTPQGKLLGTLEVPERPGSLAFGGADGKTLYIGARTALYAIRTAATGAKP
ncbi:gluconolactonase [Terriglobus roseus DSM 18391]|uniref:Gluconolactonase n=2 Tax=Terriglobus roseus TaxID=392734 RepID=I3ZLN7_TERRK|nr:gluconolactonase [Terriglobus roseus DSM 18391]